MTTTILSKRLLLIPVMLMFGCGGEDERVTRIALPKALKEISGLARIGGDLFAIADEKARLYRISFAEQTVKRVGALGNPPLKGDFEGIAADASSIFVITSDGVLYRRDLVGGDDDFEKTDTGLGAACEIEGLELVGNLAYILCKAARDKAFARKLTVFVWDVVANQRVTSLDIVIDWADLALGESGKGVLHPSALAKVENGFLIVAAREKRWLVVTKLGQYVRGGRLPNRKLHRQAEGLAVFGGATYIADEGKKHGTVTRYEGGF